VGTWSKMPKQFINEIIGIKEIESWKIGERILITSQTGTGKSQWVKDVLYEYCARSGKKILLLSNRNLLKSQNQEELSDTKIDIISLRNYQTLENSFLYGNSLEDITSKYDYVCFDEVHYLLSDSAFNSNTDILLSILRNPIKNAVNIFITATPQAILRYNSRFEYKYELEQDYSFIEKVYFYEKDETVENIISSVPPGEKILFFGNALDGFEYYLNTSDAEFICSENNKEFKKKSSRSTMKEIVTNNDFSARVLFSTKVLDNGVNIISPPLKHIIIDMADPIDLIQCLGRKRIVGDEKITLYIKNRGGRDIFPRLQSVRNKLALADERQSKTKEEFQKKYARKQLDTIIMTDGEINFAKWYYAKYLDDVYSKMIRSKDGYQKYVCNLLSASNVLSAEKYFEKKSLIELMSGYIGKKMYKEEQEEFKVLFFETIFKSKRRIDVHHRGVISVNSILEEDDIKIRLSSTQNMSGENRGKTYWILFEI